MATWNWDAKPCVVAPLAFEPYSPKLNIMYVFVWLRTLQS